MFIFRRGFRYQGFLRSGFFSLLLLLLLLSSLPPLLGGIFLDELWFSKSFPFPLLDLLDPPRNECPNGSFWVLCSGIFSVSPSSTFSWSVKTLIVICKFLIKYLLKSEASKGS